MPRERALLHDGQSLAPVRLFLISYLSLYFELLFIRWLPTEIRVLAYFNNVILISCILGMGIGALVAHRSRLVPWAFPALLGALVILAVAYNGLNLSLPLGSEGLFIWNGLSRSVKGTPLQYAAMFVFVFLNTLTFVPIGQVLGIEFDRLAPIRAYSINVLGALAGIATFAAFSAFGVPVFWWFLVGLLLLLALLPVSRRVLLASGLAVLVALVVTREANVHWSPYYKITVETFRLGDTVIGHQVNVNEDSHQQAFDLSGRYDSVGDLALRRRIYDEPYRYGTHRQVLVVGAGTGNDVAAALRAGAASVDAVEIDPVILDLGRQLHPERPYDSSRVTLVNRDARTFLRNCRTRYDTIVLGYLDSHSLFSAMSSVRLDNFVYTREFFREMLDHLNPDGVLAVTFTVHEKWIADRLHSLFRDTFGYPPLVFQGARSTSSGTVFLAGEPLRNARVEYLAYDPQSTDGHTWKYDPTLSGYLSPSVFEHAGIVPTDDWPYLYLRERSVPTNYLVCMLGLFALSFVVVRRSTGLSSIRWSFFFLGAAFLLVETKAMTELAIFLGSTWIVNCFVISAILALILLANLVVARSWAPSPRITYALLGLTLVVTYFTPLEMLLGWQSPLRSWVAVGALCLPLFFAGVIFARLLRSEQSASIALGSNLLGTLLGGVLEYASMMVGFKALYWVALVLYALSLYFHARKDASALAPAGA